ncbi:putative type VI secretion system effector [Acinetobacter baumannii]|uniref:putative type VI secretion system effector n=1 Tax=Acinetobacter baumannii TaxID=470 RepID=UPI0024479F0D|nr:putative type VI secretion system effector [Acinetobacter baumannii]MDH2605418.1 putative type VI secretion system effector [Acinetobacter baumannii]MDO7420917.1 putative type VI secretion system effector [Acinetobacter baumannii]
MYDLIKFEGRIQRLEIYDDSLSTFGKSGNTQIASSAILSGVTESVSLSAQTVFLASQSRLHVQPVVMETDGKICIGKFHRALIVENEYVICVARRLEKNLYELYSILSPKTGLLYMQVGMGASVKKYKVSAMKGAKFLYALTVVMMIGLFIYIDDYSIDNFINFGGVIILFYFVIIFIMKRAVKSLKHFSEKSEEIFKIYGFENPTEIFLLSGRHYSDDYKILLESVYEYRKVIKKDPYPENYIEQK